MSDFPFRTAHEAPFLLAIVVMLTFLGRATGGNLGIFIQSLFLLGIATATSIIAAGFISCTSFFSVVFVGIRTNGSNPLSRQLKISCLLVHLLVVHGASG